MLNKFQQETHSWCYISYCKTAITKRYSLVTLSFVIGSWCSGVVDKNQYLQIDLVKETIVTKMAIQGRPEEEDYVSSFALLYSNDARIWTSSSKARLLLFIDSFHK